MRRDWEIVRKILLAVGDDGITTSDGLMKAIGLSWDTLDYHLKLLTRPNVRLLEGEREEPMTWSESVPPHWERLVLTWEGNDFADAAADDKAWKKLKAAIIRQAPGIVVHSLQVATQVLTTAAITGILAETDTRNQPQMGGKPGKSGDADAP